MSLPSLLSYKGPFEAFFGYLEPVQQAAFSNLYAAFKAKLKPKVAFDSKNARVLAVVCIQRWWLGNFCHQALFLRHHFAYRNTAKAIPLTLVHVKTEKEREALFEKLNQWSQINQAHPPIPESLQDQSAYLANCLMRSLSSQNLATRQQMATYSITYLIDNQNQAQAFCVFKQKSSTIWEVSDLVTAPQNVVGTKAVSIPATQGCGSALLGQLILKFKATIIHLDSLQVALPAYFKMGFVQRGDTNNSSDLVLGGKNLVQFIKKYGGRI